MTESDAYNYCALPLANYACRPDMSRGRIFDEQESAHRTPFQRDRDRIIHCSAFRRLKYKTQVFVYHEGDHYRTRLTHTLEVAQIARTLARALMVNEDLAEAVALAHDLGHTPFAHVGEDVLKECMQDVGGFYHNDQSLRVLTVLERKYPGWNGLNLTWETLEGVVKHNGPYDGPMTETLQAVQGKFDLELDCYASIEAQIAALSDDIAYNNHDLEDGLRAGLFLLSEIEELTLPGDILKDIRAKWPDLSDYLTVQELIREMIGRMVSDVLSETRKRLKDTGPDTPEDVRAAGKPIVAFSADMHEKIEELRAFLWQRMYMHFSVNRMRLKVSRVVRDLYAAFNDNFTLLPDNWQRRVLEAGGFDDKSKRARIIADYIAGMTDRYAMREHEKLFRLYDDLR